MTEELARLRTQFKALCFVINKLQTSDDWGTDQGSTGRFHCIELCRMRDELVIKINHLEWD